MAIDPRMIDAPWSDDRYIEDLEPDDKKQLERCWDKAKGHFFGNLAETKVFLGRTVMDVLSRLGVAEKMDPSEIDRQMISNQVKVEHRLAYPAEEAWRKGIYIYKNEELVAFVSHPVVNTPRLNKSTSSRIVLPASLSRFVVWTNAHEIVGKLYQKPAQT